ncbi:MAG: hypothetical protein Q4G21_06320 [Dermabacter sp.]|nr:hypothetical protein [Dermabacter sp.]
MNIRRPSTRTAAIVGAAALGLALSGCGYFSPVQTQVFYQSAEGAIANLDIEGVDNPVGLRNLVIVDASGTKTLSGTLTNQTSTGVMVDLEVFDGATSVATASFFVPAQGAVELGGVDGTFDVSAITAPAGANAIVVARAGGLEEPITVPILDDSLDYLVPAPSDGGQ